MLLPALRFSCGPECRLAPWAGRREICRPSSRRCIGSLAQERKIRREIRASTEQLRPEPEGFAARSSASSFPRPATQRRPKLLRSFSACFLRSHRQEMVFQFLAIGLKPCRSRNLGLFGHVLIHLNSNTGPVRRSDVTIYDDFAFRYPVCPEIHVINPMPLAAQEIGEGRA